MNPDPAQPKHLDNPFVNAAASQFPTEKLYSPAQIGVAAFLGSPLAAGWFFSRNEKALGHRGAAVGWLLGAVIATFALVVISAMLPAHFPTFILPLAYIVALRLVAQNLYEKALAAHAARGGMLGSWWMVVGVSLGLLILIMGLVFLVVIFPLTRGG